jgi:hypothetical protein
MLDRMEHHDAEITEIVIILSQTCEGKLSQAIESVRQAGVDVISTDEENFVVNGTIGSEKVGSIEKLACVNYVRLVQTYVADFPTGDPRDLDGREEEPEEED